MGQKRKGQEQQVGAAHGRTGAKEQFNNRRGQGQHQKDFEGMVGARVNRAEILERVVGAMGG